MQVKIETKEIKMSQTSSKIVDIKHNPVFITFLLYQLGNCELNNTGKMRQTCMNFLTKVK